LKIHPVGAKLFHADGWTEGQIDRHDKALVAFHNFVNMPKNATVFSFCTNLIYSMQK